VALSRNSPWPTAVDSVFRWSVGAGEVRAAVAHHELDPVRLLAEVHDQVPGLLGTPLPGWMQSEPENADTLAGVLDHGQDAGLGAVEQVGSDEVTRQDRLGLRAQEQ
jgi:hypothetical protein